MQGDVAESLGVPGKGDAVVGQIEVVKGEQPDRPGTGGMDRGQGDDQPLRRVRGGYLDGANLVLRRRCLTSDRGGAQQHARPPVTLAAEEARGNGYPR